MATQRLKTAAAGPAGGLVEDGKKGNYFGTEIDRKWWKRYRRDGLFARGNGSFWLDEDGIRFHKLLTRKPFLIPWAEIRGAELGKWHAGRWAMGRPVLKVDFERGGERLCAGFFLSPDWAGMQRLADDLSAKARRRAR
jgi:hypothetical protein